MKSCTGEDLLTTFQNLKIDLGNLSPNVIKAWFDTDCEATRELLNWMCIYLSKDNIITPLEKAEYERLETKLDLPTVKQELAKLNYADILDHNDEYDEIAQMEDELLLLEQENDRLEDLILIYDNLDTRLSSDLVLKTQKEIESRVECQKEQEVCEGLCRNLDELDGKFHERINKYDPDCHMVNFVDMEEYSQIIDNMRSFLKPMEEINKTILEKSDDHLSDELETCRNRILQSHLIYLYNKIQIGKYNAVLHLLNTVNLQECVFNCGSSSSASEAKEQYLKKLYDVVYTIPGKVADFHLKQTKISYLQQELDDLQQKSLNVSGMLKHLSKCQSYFALVNLLLSAERKDVECISKFYQKMVTYANEDLQRCVSRTDKMSEIIADHEAYMSLPLYERSPLISSIMKILGSNCTSLRSAFDVIGKFKSELNALESEVFEFDINKEAQSADISVLQSFLISGPTKQVVLIPLVVEKVWLEIEDHLKKEGASSEQAMQVLLKVKKAATKSHTFQNKLWQAFLSDSSKLSSIIGQAKEEFEKRTAHYF